MMVDEVVSVNKYSVSTPFSPVSPSSWNVSVASVDPLQSCSGDLGLEMENCVLLSVFFILFFVLCVLLCRIS